MQSFEHGDGLLDVVHQHRFSDLELERRRVQRRGSQCLFDHVGQIRVGELARRDVHGDSNRAAGSIAQDPNLLAGPTDRPLAERHDEAAFLRDIDEIVRGEESATRVAPAQQRFHTDKLLLIDADLWLVEKLELLTAEGASEFVLQDQSVHGAGVHVLGEKLIVVTSALLGAVHGEVSVLYEGCGVGAVVGRQGDSDAGRHAEFVVRDHDRLGQCLQHLAGNPTRRAAVSDLIEQDREFVAAEAPHGVFFPNALLQTAGDTA